MQNRHVRALHFRLVTDGTINFDNAPPVEGETELFHFRLAHDILTMEMKTHCASIEDAKAHARPFLRGWEIDSGLRFGPGAISFRFDSADMLDPSAMPDQPIQLTTLERSQPMFMSVLPPPARQMSHYPEPPSGFRTSPDVEMMWLRYQGYLDGGEPLQTMAYFCLTVLQGPAKNRSKAAKRYGVSNSVLDELGKLSSEFGDSRTARKVPDAQNLRPLTERESRWVEAVIKALIRRVGEWAASPDAARTVLTMSDFPPLSDTGRDELTHEKADGEESVE